MVVIAMFASLTLAMLFIWALAYVDCRLIERQVKRNAESRAERFCRILKESE